jgi:hypothetical protein
MMGEMLQQIGRPLLPIICGMNSASEPLNPQMGLFTRGKSTVDESDTLIDTRTQSEEDLEAGDHERFAHYVRKEKIVESAVSGKPVTALCGKRWIPSRDPNKFPICPTCKEIHAGLRKGPDDGSKQS